MLNALTYVTRRCPRKCEYCALRDAIDVGPELNNEQWIHAFEILKELGVEFNLILGNECWLLKDDLITIMSQNKVPYALYTTCPEPLFTNYRDKMFQVVDNLSCGVDWPLSYLLKKKEQDMSDDEKKSLSAWRGFAWFKKHHPDMDCQGTITVSKKNALYVYDTVRELSELGVFVGINFIHWNSDGLFDFFPPRSVLKDWVFDDEYDKTMLVNVLNDVIQDPGRLQNPEMLQMDFDKMINMGWHCQGNPYGGPTIDADGSLRVCGYRKGKETSKFSIFDLPEKLEEWKKAVYTDAMNCPGCSWSYPWMFHYWEEKNGEMGNDVFVKHAGDHIPKKDWSERRIK